MCVYLYIYLHLVQDLVYQRYVYVKNVEKLASCTFRNLKKTQHSDPSFFGKTNHPFFSWTTWVVCESHAVEKDGFINPWLPWLRWRVIGLRICATRIPGLENSSVKVGKGWKRAQNISIIRYYKPMRGLEVFIFFACISRMNIKLWLLFNFGVFILGWPLVSFFWGSSQIKNRTWLSLLHGVNMKNWFPQVAWSSALYDP